MKFLIIGSLFVLSVSARPDAEPQFYRKGIDHTSGFVRYTNGAIVPDDTASVKAVKAEHLMAKAYADSEFETPEIIGERTPDVYNNIEDTEAKPYAKVQTSEVRPNHKAQAMPLKTVMKTLKEMNDENVQETPAIYAFNPYYQFYQPQVYGFQHQQVVAPQDYRRHFYQPRFYVHHFGKRDAEAEAEPEPEAEADAQFYNYYGTYPTTYATKGFAYSFNTNTYPYTTTTYAGYPYATYNSAYARYPSTYNTYGYYPNNYAKTVDASSLYATKAQPMPLRHYVKTLANMKTQMRIVREAEADPEADAQYYGRYFNTYATPFTGYGYPYGLNTYTGYPYSTYRTYSNTYNNRYYSTYRG